MGQPVKCSNQSLWTIKRIFVRWWVLKNRIERKSKSQKNTLTEDFLKLGNLKIAVWPIIIRLFVLKSLIKRSEEIRRRIEIRQELLKSMLMPFLIIRWDIVVFADGTV